MDHKIEAVNGFVQVMSSCDSSEIYIKSQNKDSIEFSLIKINKAQAESLVEVLQSFISKEVYNGRIASPN